MADLHEQPVLPDIEQAADDARVQNPIRDSLVKAMATGEAAVQEVAQHVVSSQANCKHKGHQAFP